MDSGGLISRAIERPVSVLVGVVLVIMFGWLSVADLPIQLTPDIAIPTLSVSTVWPGAGPEEIESEILEPQEEALKSLPNLERMVSEARLDRASITLELSVGTSIEESLVRVTNLLSQVPSYPATARQPVISASNSSGPPLAVLAITTITKGEDPAQYRTWVQEKIQPRLARIDGVADVRLFGGKDRELKIEFDPTAMAARGLTIGAVSRVLRSELRDISGGDITVGKRRLLVRTPLAPTRPEDLEDIVLASTAGGGAVLLGDVANVRLGLRKPGALVFGDGERSMAFLLFREAGSNVLAVTEEIKRQSALLQDSMLEGQGLQMRLVSEQTGYINGALDLVRQNFLVGGALAIVVLLLFLGSWRASALVSIAIPVCSFGTALGMSAAGRTINVVSLAGMAFAVGMVVDNAIVVLENIDTWRKNHDSRTAALGGAKEVWGAILASTLTTAVVFIPIITWQDEVGEILRDIAVAISLAVGVSLIVSVLVIPSFSVVLLKNGGGKEAAGGVAKAAASIRARIGGQVRRLVSSQVLSVMVVVVSVGASIGAIALWLPSMEYLPTGNRGFVFGILVPPPGLSVNEMAQVGEQVCAELVEHTGVEKDGVPAVERSFFVANPGGAFMGAGVVDDTRVDELAGWLRGVLGKVPGMFGIASKASLFGRSIGGGRGIEIELTGPHLSSLTMVGGMLMGAVRQALPGSQLRPIPGLDAGAPELHVVPKRKQAAAMGMSGAEIGLAVDALVDGSIIGEFGEGGEPKIDVVLTTAHGKIDAREALSAAPVATPSGRVVTIGTIADIREALGPTVIRRIERSRSITIAVSPPDEVPLEDAMNLIRDEVVAGLSASGKIPADVAVELSGTAGQLEVAKARFGGVLLLAVLISFLLMAALFEDFIAPVAVMITVPLAGAGGVIALRLVDRFLGKQTFDMLTAVGFVILVGVVVNNAILVVDGAMRRLEAGAALSDAVSGAVESRVRPIFMSATTSMAGLSPLVLFGGSGSELYRGVGAIVLGGLALSTALTVYVVPALFALLWRLRGVR